MNYKLAKEIYGQCWLMDAISMQSLFPLLEIAKTKREYDEKSNTPGLIELSSATIIDNIRNIDEDSTGEFISLIRLDGVITRHGGASNYGTIELAQQLRKFDNNDKIIGHILFVESGGGSSNAVIEMAEAIQELKKPIVTFSDEIMASATFYIASYTDWIISHREDDKVGGIGTYIQLGGYPKISEDKTDGFRMIRIYAEKSILKNNEFEEAINNLNFKPIIEEDLNPVNEKFISEVEKNRPNIREIEKTGKIFRAKEVKGTLIDDIGTMEDAINKVLELSGTSSNINNNNMTVQELKEKHPDLYAEVIKSERDRVDAYLTFADVDLKAVKEGIESGENPTQKFYAEMSRKAMNKNELKKAEEDSPEEIKTAKETEIKKESSIEEAKFEKEALEAAGVKVEDKK